MSYTPNFNNPYPNGWKDLPNETTPINASALQAHTDAIEADEQYLQSLDATVDGKVSIQGFAKTWSARTWNKGEILYDGGKTYIANTNTAQRPPHADWTQTNLGDEVSAINSDLSIKTKTINTQYGQLFLAKSGKNVMVRGILNANIPSGSGPFEIVSANSEPWLKSAVTNCGFSLLGDGVGYTQVGSVWIYSNGKVEFYKTTTATPNTVYFTLNIICEE